MTRSGPCTAKGQPVATIAAQVDRDRRTIQHYLRLPTWPRPQHRSTYGRSVLNPYTPIGWSAGMRAVGSPLSCFGSCKRKATRGATAASPRIRVAYARSALASPPSGSSPDAACGGGAHHADPHAAPGHLGGPAASRAAHRRLRPSNWHRSERSPRRSPSDRSREEDRPPSYGSASRPSSIRG